MRWISVLLMATVVCSGQDHMDFWLTDPDRKILFQEQSPLHPTADRRVRSSIVIEVNSTERYQSMDGFGFALTGGSALHIYQLENVTRAALLQELFAADKTNIGISYLRLSIGASDLNAVVFSYDDLGPGETDVNMTRFTLDADRTSLIPLLKEILAINPQIKLLGSPWSPPVWMKSNEKTIGGNLLRKYYDAYALYFVRYIQGMKAEGINIDAITIQNEALYGGNNPSMVMHAKEQAEFIKSSLGPAFRLNEIATKIFIYDHNPDRPDYPLTILADPEARNYVDGSAFHMYAGRIETLSLVHAAHPDKNIYFTEEWIAAPGNLKSDLAWHVKTLIVGATRNWGENRRRMESSVGFEMGTSHTAWMWQLSRSLDHRWKSRSFTEKSRILYHRSCRKVRSTEFRENRNQCRLQSCQCCLSTWRRWTSSAHCAQREGKRRNNVRNSFRRESLSGDIEWGQRGYIHLVMKEFTSVFWSTGNKSIFLSDRNSHFRLRKRSRGAFPSSADS